MPFSLDHMQEKIEFHNGYNRYRKWVESEGLLNTDWYLSIDGYRNNKKLISLNRNLDFNDSRVCTDEDRQQESENLTLVENQSGGEYEIPEEEVEFEIDNNVDHFKDTYTKTVEIGPFDDLSNTRELMDATISYDLKADNLVTGKNINNNENADGTIQITQTAKVLSGDTEVDTISVDEVYEFLQVSPSAESDYANFLNGIINTKLFPSRSLSNSTKGSFKLTSEQIEKLKTEKISITFEHIPEARLVDTDTNLGFDLKFSIAGKVSVRYLSKVKIAKGIQFTDIAIDNEIRKQLNKYIGPITVADCNQITKLNLSNKSLKSLEGLQFCKNITDLNLHNNKITDVSILSSLTKLNVLNIGNNPISDISYLSDINSLQKLYLNDMTFKNLKALKNLSNLQVLELKNNALDDISDISSLLNLYYLDLSGVKNVDVSILSNLNSLQYLLLSNCNPLNLETLRNIQSLKLLNLNSNGLNDVSWLKNFSNLADISLVNNNLSSYPTQEGMPLLTHLRLARNKFVNIDFLLSYKSQLKHLELYDNPDILDYSPLNSFYPGLHTLNLARNSNLGNQLSGEYPSLRNIYLDQTSMNDFSLFQDHPRLSRVYANSNNISDFSIFRSLSNLQHLKVMHNELSNGLGEIREVWSNVSTLDFRGNNLTCADINALYYYIYRQKSVKFDELEGCEITERNPILDFNAFLTDVNLNYYTRLSINKLEGDLEVIDVINLKELDVSGKKIESLEGIKNIQSLENLEIDSNNISDFSEISFLQNLKSLNLSNTSLSDISFLESLVNLETLSFNNTNVIDISTLLNLNNLKTVNMTGIAFDCNQLSAITSLIDKGVNLSFEALQDCSIEEKVIISQVVEQTVNSSFSFSNLNSEQLTFTDTQSQNVVFSDVQTPEGAVLTKLTVKVYYENLCKVVAKNFNSDEVVGGSISLNSSSDISSDLLNLNFSTLTVESDGSFENVSLSTLEEYISFVNSGSLNSPLFPQTDCSKSSAESFEITDNKKLSSLEGNDINVLFNHSLSATREDTQVDILFDGQSSAGVKISLEFFYEI